LIKAENGCRNGKESNQPQFAFSSKIRKVSDKSSCEGMHLDFKAHNPKVVGSNPASATNKPAWQPAMRDFFCLFFD